MTHLFLAAVLACAPGQCPNGVCPIRPALARPAPTPPAARTAIRPTDGAPAVKAVVQRRPVRALVRRLLHR